MKEYYPKIDILRLLMCLAILLYHLNILKGGYLAVCSFFVLSGYLSTASAQRERVFSVTDYLKKRVFRLYLPLLVVVFGTIALLSLFPTVRWLNLKPETLSVLFGYNNYWQLRANLDYFTRHISSPFMHLWYLAILMQYELLFPFVHILLRKSSRKKSKIIPLLLLLLLSVISFLLFVEQYQSGNVMQAYYGSLERLFAPLLGSLLAFFHFYYRPLTIENGKTKQTVFTVYLIILAGMFLFDSPERQMMPLSFLIVTLITLRLTDYAVADPGKRKGDWVNYLAGCVYEIYLVQYPVIYLLQELHLNRILMIPLCIILTVLIAALLHEVLRFPLRKKKEYYRLAITLPLLIISLLGAKRFILAQDHSAEMKELQEKLAENQKLIEEKNKEYKNREAERQAEWEEFLRSTEDEEAYVSGMMEKLPVVGIGDSILLDAVGKLYDHFPNGYFDGEISRSLGVGMDLLQQMKDEDKLPDTIILCLSTNGYYKRSRCENLMEIIGDRELFWVDAVGADDENYNSRFRSFAAEYPNIHIVEWEKASANHPEYFYYDGIHVIGKGVSAFADLIYDTVYETYLNKFKTEKEQIIADKKSELNQSRAIYGNDVLLSCYSDLQKQESDAVIYAKSGYGYEDLYANLKQKINDETLENQLYFLFDASADLTLTEYQKIVELCEGHKITVFNLTEEDLSSLRGELSIVDCFSALQAEDCFMEDGIHLLEKGNGILSGIILQNMK